MTTPFPPMFKRCIHNPFPSPTASDVLDMNMEWQLHSIGFQEAFALFTFDEAINVVDDFACGKYCIFEPFFPMKPPLPLNLFNQICPVDF
jgi:hypothetical protein